MRYGYLRSFVYHSICAYFNGLVNTLLFKYNKLADKSKKTNDTKLNRAS